MANRSNLPTVKLSKSKTKGKKWTVTIGSRRVSFGASGYLDYTQHKDPVRRAAYIARHATRENWNDPSTAGFWSRWLLWERPTIAEAKKEITRRSGIRFV
jgi:hypothetical protein